MLTVYVLEPPTKGKVIITTSYGPLDMELWPKEAPKAARNFVQLCLEGYYNNTIFHRVIKSFLVQGGDPTGTGEAKRMFESRISLRNYSKFGGVRCGGGAQMEQEQEEQHDDSYYIRRCVELARTAIGYTSPNPMVGCVIVKDGKIVGKGFHPKAGQPHAEVFALRDAGDLAENGTAYVSLEPCNHYGRTPPCTEALIKAKVKKVVIGVVIRKLRDAGIEVTVGVEEELCKKLNEAYIHQMLTGKPFVTLSVMNWWNMELQ